MNKKRLLMVMGGKQRVIPITYIFREEFTTPEAHPMVTPRTAEPSPGAWTLTTVAGSISINASGQCSIVGENANFDQTTLVSTEEIVYAPGRALFFDRVSGDPWCRHGYKHSGGATYLGFDFSAKAIVRNTSNFGMPTLNYSKFGIIRTATRVLFIAYTGTAWILLFELDYLNVGFNYYIKFDNMGNQTFVFDNVVVYDLAAPYTTDYGIVTNRVAAPSDGEITTSSANALTYFNWTPAESEVLNLMFRRTDDDNTWILRCTQADGTIKLFEKVEGSETEREAGKTQTWTAGTKYRICVITDGQNIHTLVAGNPKHNYTSGTFNQTATSVKVAGFTTGSELVCFPRYVPSF